MCKVRLDSNSFRMLGSFWIEQFAASEEFGVEIYSRAISGEVMQRYFTAFFCCVSFRKHPES
jgi:hypothetical protein